MTDNDQHTVVLPDALLAGLGPYVAGGELSPFAPFSGDAVLADADRSTLRDLGLLESSGAIAPPFRRAVQVLGTARAVAHLELIGGTGTLEYDQWFDPGGGLPVSLTPAADGLRLEDPAAAPGLVALLSETLGQSTLQGTDLDLELDARSASVLAALVDARRRQVLRALADADDLTALAELPAPGFGLTAARQAVAQAGSGPQWFTGALADMDVAVPPATEVGQALEDLVASGAMTEDGRRFVFADAVSALAERLLVVEKVLRVAAGRAGDDGAVLRAGFTCLQGGAQDLLLIERVDDRIRFEAVSAAAVLVAVRRFLTDPEVVSDDPSAAQAAQATPATPAAQAALSPGPANGASGTHGSNGWVPTHVVPEHGLSTWTEPDPASDKAAALGPRLPVLVDERRGDWAHVVCSNGWEAWVDARALEPLST